MTGLLASIGQSISTAAGGLVDAGNAAIAKEVAAAQAKAEKQAVDALGEVATRISNDPVVTAAVHKVGVAASGPTSKALQPQIIMATGIAIVSIAVIVYLARKH